MGVWAQQMSRQGLGELRWQRRRRCKRRLALQAASDVALHPAVLGDVAGLEEAGAPAPPIDGLMQEMRVFMEALDRPLGVAASFR
jgi:hypothetical protein